MLYKMQGIAVGMLNFGGQCKKSVVKNKFWWSINKFRFQAADLPNYFGGN